MNLLRLLSITSVVSALPLPNQSIPTIHSSYFSYLTNFDPYLATKTASRGHYDIRFSSSFKIRKQQTHVGLWTWHPVISRNSRNLSYIFSRLNYRNKSDDIGNGYNCDNAIVNNSPIHRRACLKSLLFKFVSTVGLTSGFSSFSPSLSNALGPEIEEGGKIVKDTSPILRGMVTLKTGAEFKPSSSTMDTPALYITARPEDMSNAPKELVEILGGRPPPILTARFPMKDQALNSENAASQLSENFFPFSFEITTNDITTEGAYVERNPLGEKKDFDDPPLEYMTQYWWEKNNLVISARLDLDGVAATRDPEDLVGRTISFVNSNSKGQNNGEDISKRRGDIVIELQGRGVGGKFVTRKQVK